MRAEDEAIDLLSKTWNLKNLVHDPMAEKCYVINLKKKYVPVFKGNVISTAVGTSTFETIYKNLDLVEENPYNYVLCDDVVVEDGELTEPNPLDFMPPKLFGCNIAKFGDYYDEYTYTFNLGDVIETAATYSHHEKEIFNEPFDRLSEDPYDIDINLSFINEPYRKEVQQFLDKSHPHVPASYWGGIENAHDEPPYYLNEYVPAIKFEYKHPYPFTVYYYKTFNPEGPREWMCD